jgi:hypothetical protein
MAEGSKLPAPRVPISAELDFAEAVALLKRLDGRRVTCRVADGPGAPIEAEGRLAWRAAGSPAAIDFTVGAAAAFFVDPERFAGGRREGGAIEVDTGVGRPRRRLTVEPAPRTRAGREPRADGDPAEADARRA